MDEEKPEIKKLKAWLKKDGNSSMQIALALGYRSATTINKWIENNNIPYWKRSLVAEHIKGEKK